MCVILTVSEFGIPKHFLFPPVQGTSGSVIQKQVGEVGAKGL
jgi:hypothetical protein